MAHCAVLLPAQADGDAYRRQGSSSSDAGARATSPSAPTRTSPGSTTHGSRPAAGSACSTTAAATSRTAHRNRSRTAWSWTWTSTAAARTYYHRPPLFSASQGNTQSLDNGNKFIGWGQSSYYSEYADAGNAQGDGSENLLYDAELPGSNISYRAFRNTWVGKPHYPPSAAARTDGGNSVVYASWNGSTQTTAWRVLAGPDPASLAVVVRHARRTGFETAVPTDGPGPYFRVQALDDKGGASSPPRS